GWNTATATRDARYAPQKKMPALTRPRSVAGTMNRSRKRTVSSAIAMTGSDPCADHSCAKREGKSFHFIMVHPDAARSGRAYRRCRGAGPGNLASDAREGGLGGDAETVIARR